MSVSRPATSSRTDLAQSLLACLEWCASRLELAIPDTAPPADGAALTSSYLQTMVREQVIRTVTSSTRPTGVEGAVIYETDTDSFYYYTGSAWATFVGITPIVNYAWFREEQTNGTNGGSSAATTWTKRTLNTSKANTISSCTLTSSVISLPAGTYYVQASSPLVSSLQGRVRVRDTTTPATLLVSASEYAATGTGIRPSVRGSFTITGTKNVEVQYYSVSAVGTNGLGVASSSGEVEVFSEIEIFRTA